MRKTITNLIATTLLIAAFPVVPKAATPYGTVTYVAAEAAYLDAGSAQGLKTGDTLVVMRNKKKVGAVVLTQVASKSAACRPLDPSVTLKVNDLVRLPETQAADQPKASVVVSESSPRPSRSSAVNRFRGDLQLEQFTHKDFTGSHMSWYQPGVRSRFRVQNISNSGVDFNFRHRTRLYRRTRIIVADGQRDEWTHRVYEASFTFDRDDAGSEWGIGRLSVPHLRGFGLIDGGYYTRHLSGTVSAGVGAGSVPDYESSAPDFNRRKFGIYAAYARRVSGLGDMDWAAAFSSEYDDGATSRDFLYIQNSLRRSGLFSLHQSVEIDLNRDWRMRAAGKRLQLTNYFGSLHVTAHRALRLHASYDTRRTVRRAESRTLADSLFNDASTNGIRGGFTIAPTGRIQIQSSVGLRFREDGISDSRFMSGSVRLRQFPAARQSVVLRVTQLKSHYSTGYRPLIRYDFTLGRRINMNLGASGYIEKTGGTRQSSYAVNFGSTYYLSGRYTFSGHYRQFLDSRYRSGELQTSLGISL